MANPLERLLGDPWQLLNAVVEGPLHPGGDEATQGLLDRAGVESGTHVLDVGCGRGNALELVRERGANAVGLDRRPAEMGIVQGDVATLPFREDSFDVVLSECVLCLSDDLERTLRGINRLLEPGGRLAFSDVTVEGTPPEIPPPFRGMLCLSGERERAHIERQIRRAGFEIQDVETHHEDVLEMRDRIVDAVDYERFESLLGEQNTALRDGTADLETAVETGRVGYVSIVATNRREQSVHSER